MTRVVLAMAALAALGTIGFSSAVLTAGPNTLRILTYNIHHGEGMDGEFDLQRLADIITSAEPDLVALQEVDQATKRSAGVNQATELGRLTRMHVAFGRAMEFQGGEYGVAILSRWPFLQTDNRALPHGEGLEPRTVLTVEVDSGAGRPFVAFSNTHLDQGRDAANVANRLLQAAYLNQALAREDQASSILAGDMNSRLDSDVMLALRSWWTDLFLEPEPSLPSERPPYKVDYVLARHGDRWRTLESRAIEAPLASDHRAVLVVLEWSSANQ